MFEPREGVYEIIFTFPKFRPSSLLPILNDQSLTLEVSEVFPRHCTRNGNCAICAMDWWTSLEQSRIFHQSMCYRSEVRTYHMLSRVAAPYSKHATPYTIGLLMKSKSCDQKHGSLPVSWTPILCSPVHL